MKINFLKNIKLKFTVWLLLSLLLVLSAIFFVENKQSQKTLQQVVVNIRNEYENYFIDEKDVMKLITAGDRELLIHKNYDSVNLKKLEQRIEAHHFVEDAQVFKDHKGNLVIDVEQCRPIARIVRNDEIGAYISDHGITISTSEKYTARVLIIDGDYTRKMMQPNFFSTAEGQPYFEFLSHIEKIQFWKTQIAQITIDRNGEMSLTPQLGREIIEFGTPENFEDKLNKLMVFYKKILPLKGWNTYEVVKVKFKNQIVCERSSTI